MTYLTIAILHDLLDYVSHDWLRMVTVYASTVPYMYLAAVVIRTSLSARLTACMHELSAKCKCLTRLWLANNWNSKKVMQSINPSPQNVKCIAIFFLEIRHFNIENLNICHKILENWIHKYICVCVCVCASAWVRACVCIGLCIYYM